jgi:hypothetical protein
VRTNVPLLITLPAIARDFTQLLRASLIPIAHLLRRFRDPLVDASSRVTSETEIFDRRRVETSDGGFEFEFE